MASVTCRSLRISSLLAFLAIAQFASWGLAQTSRPAGSADALDRQNSALQNKVDAMQHEMDQVKSQLSDIQAQQAAAKPAPSPNFFDVSDWQAGYAKGFYIADGNQFKLAVNGLFDGRYSFVHAENHSGLANTALGPSPVGDMSGFNISNAEVGLTGTIFQHINFKVLANFGTTSSFTSPTIGTFQLLEYWGAYSFSPKFNIRLGSFIIPFVPVRTLANYGGSQFPDLSDVTAPFLAGYGLGADIYGAVANQTISYDLMVGNGSNSQSLVDSTAPAAGRDNRFSVYTREQWAGAGTVTDFVDDETDVVYHPNLAWIVGGGFGWESQNSAANAFPGPQTTTQIGGLSAIPTTAGFMPAKYVLDGDLVRAAANFRSKYRGWSTFAEVYYQDIDAESGTIITGSPHTNVQQLGYFLQSGFFLIPHRLDVAARFGELFTLAFPHRMDEYTLGLDYYVAGENMKVQLAETYVPISAVTSGNGALVNTQDFITQLQLQVRF